MDEMIEIFKRITSKADECDALVTISEVSNGLKHILDILEKESVAFKKLKESNKDMFIAAQVEFICSYLASMYVNAIARSPEEAEELMKEFKPNGDKVTMKRKADA